MSTTISWNKIRPSSFLHINKMLPNAEHSFRLNFLRELLRQLAGVVHTKKIVIVMAEEKKEEKAN